MTQRALVIKTYGNPEIAGAIVDGMSRSMIPLNENELAAVKLAYIELKERNGLKKTGDDRRFEAWKREMDLKYAERPSNALKDGFWVGYALGSLAIETALKRLTARLKRRCW